MEVFYFMQDYSNEILYFVFQVVNRENILFYDSDFFRRSEDTWGGCIFAVVESHCFGSSLPQIV